MAKITIFDGDGTKTVRRVIRAKCPECGGRIKQSLLLGKPPLVGGNRCSFCGAVIAIKAKESSDKAIKEAMLRAVKTIEENTGKLAKDRIIHRP